MGESIKGLDGIACTRAAKIQASTGKINRPVVKLLPLELSYKVTDISGSQEVET